MIKCKLQKISNYSCILTIKHIKSNEFGICNVLFSLQIIKDDHVIHEPKSHPQQIVDINLEDNL